MEHDERLQALSGSFGHSIPGDLLLRAVAPMTLLQYLESLLKFLQWRAAVGEPVPRGVGDLDDSMSRWIQSCYDCWNSFETAEGRQICVYARCGLLLLWPRLIGLLRTSGRMLEA